MPASLVTSATLKQKLNDGVVELRFQRRMAKPGFSPIRHMLATNNKKILGGINGRLTLNYRPPRYMMSYNPYARGLLVVWDIFMQDYRMVNTQGPLAIAQEFTDEEEFWKYFNKHIRRMSQAQKMAYMDS